METYIHKTQTAQKFDSKTQNSKNHNRSIALERFCNIKLLRGLNRFQKGSISALTALTAHTDLAVNRVNAIGENSNFSSQLRTEFQ